MIIPPRADGSVDSASERFVAAAREALALQTATHASAWRFGEEDSWSADLEAGSIVFEFSDGTIAGAPIQVVGTFDTVEGSFLWGWDHPSVPEHLRKHARLARQWGEKSGVVTFTSRKVACTEDDAWGMAAVTSRLANANGVYRGPAGSALVFLTFGEIKLEVADA